MGYSELLANQAQHVPAFGFTNLALYSISLALIIQELMLLGCQQLRIVLRSSQTWAA